MNKKKVLIVLTGGTISMKNHLKTSKVIMHEGYNDLLSALVEGLDYIEISHHVFSLLPSPAMTDQMMLELARLIEYEISKNIYSGIVITHGTDTMEETAYFLQCYTNWKIPVVLTGSMRNLSELGFDGLSNLASATLVASHESSINRGVLVVMNDEINSASEVIKTHTVALDTFKSPEFGPLGIVDQKNVLYFRSTSSTTRLFGIDKINKTVEIVKTYAGMSSFLIKTLVDSGVSGIVIEALGRGNVPPQMLDGIKYALDSGVVLVLTSRCLKGRVLDTYAYNGGGAHLRTLGVLFAPYHSAQKARIKLILALNATKELNLVELFNSN